MLAIILILTIITIAIMVPIMKLAVCNAAKEKDEALEHPERIAIKGDK